MKTVLAIETSCDDTSVAIVTSNKQVLAHQTISQKEHIKFGGVVPEIAARNHMTHLKDLIQSTLYTANLNCHDLYAIAATTGPGLIGGLIVGTMMAKAIAHVIQKPFISVNHLEAHALVIRLLYDIQFPFLVLLISGGHCKLLIAQNVGQYIQLGTTLDDALGEVFDKVAKMLGLQYPGGPIIERYAKQGNGKKFRLPRAMLGRVGCDFSFSGLKTSVQNLVRSIEMTKQNIYDICASFQTCVIDILLDRINNAIIMTESLDIKINNVVVTGGVASNQFLIQKLQKIIKLNIFVPPHALCTDNAVMVGWTGIEMLHKNCIASLNCIPRAKWELVSEQST
ncbi:tRNA (adenosine(37)-N6)-threonylcarbamoyltransferase complex transferase subunit TsaD [Wolbachia endosymbiont of Howardula sp.]|uniref:tRNA (adenosine(37)-N6)-threonylcarbamoyltransferase complex transferase subunit TsaD n=1 Tax=Wolbachia endosymbiont of Howardula sp. TaxID=2916816 RepID=UPI00217DED21|nr:tRNA (adenosine(37)-N6)-threonylcarbamoyltransferase complex transferase subunit TsaD [Wolbachia endosymbiont of Howardula sp.]UWI83227.1 tRNA (adenosine(37)-N6)-threonylcarbamoyltransferase complex transferase subunit TsaD [Wolbachia endosymbiont of Howardula sp.]